MSKNTIAPFRYYYAADASGSPVCRAQLSPRGARDHAHRLRRRVPGVHVIQLPNRALAQDGAR